MNPQSDTVGGAEDDAKNGPQATGVIQPKKHATIRNSAKETKAEHSQVETVIQQPDSLLKPHATSLDDHCEKPQESNVLKQNASAFHSRSFTGRNTSLDHLQQSSHIWQNVTTTGAAQVPLPCSRNSSVLSTQGLVDAPLPSGQSLEDLELRPENIALPSRKKVNPFISWVGGPAASRPKRKTKKKQAATTAPPAIADEVEHYRNNVMRLADHFANFHNVASTDTRHEWCSRIVLYDRLESEHYQPPRRYEPWPNQVSAPSYREFYSTLRTVADTCEQRIVLVEDLSPSLVDLLGATFDIPPHVFEEHLDRSGYQRRAESRKGASAWDTRSSAQGYSSVTWYRPVLPSMPLTSRLRTELIKNQSVPVRCPLEGCQQHNIPLGTIGNIWRHFTELCSEPGKYYKGSETEYPVGWEERATVWTQDFDGCKFVVVLLDPLPVVVVKLERLPTAPKYERLIPMGNRWIIKEEGMYKERRPRNPRSQQIVDDWIDRATFPVYSEGWVPAPAPTPVMHSGPNHMGNSQPQTTGTDIDPAQAAFTPTALRRRATRSDREQVPTAVFDLSANLPGYIKQETHDSNDHHPVSPPPLPQTVPPPSTRPLPHPSGQLPVPPLPPQSLLSQSADQASVAVEDHGPFVPYTLIKARSSSSASDDVTFVTKHMRAYIESLQIPRSTLDEFDHFLQAPARVKENQYDPFHALFRAIYDDSHSLVDVIRKSLHRIREGTLDEDLMQKRVTFWRALLHRLNFNLGELDQNLGAFAQFINEPETHTSQALLPSQKLAENTQVTLRNCVGLIDRSSHSLLAEMQIVDSRRSITEAESISKLTELAFVFIPLSFVASLFSMQVHELDGGVPLYQFALVAIGFVIVAYLVRLSIRSSHLIDYKDNTIAQIREETGLQHNEPIPTHKFLGWLGFSLGAAISRNTRNFISVFAPLTLGVALLAAILCPVLLLWLRRMDKGLKAAITVLLLLLDFVLIFSVLSQISDKFEFNFQERVRENQRIRRLNRKKREKAKRRRRRTAGGDPEQAESDSTISSSEDRHGVPET